MRALFTELTEAPDGLAAKDAIEAVRSKVTIAPQEQGNFESAVEKFPKVLRFSTIPVTKAGWLQKKDGIWTVTADGLTALEQYTQPEEFWQHGWSLYAQWKKTATIELEADDSETEVDEATSLGDAEDEARTEILDYLGKMPPFDFQSACAKLVDALGHRIAWISPPDPDGGLDFVAYADP